MEVLVDSSEAGVEVTAMMVNINGSCMFWDAAGKRNPKTARQQWLWYKRGKADRVKRSFFFREKEKGRKIETERSTTVTRMSPGLGQWGRLAKTRLTSQIWIADTYLSQHATCNPPPTHSHCYTHRETSTSFLLLFLHLNKKNLCKL